MSDVNFVLPAQYVTQVADQVTRMGVRLPDWFLALQRPNAQGELEVQSLSFEQFKRLVREALALTGEPAFGLLVGDRLLVNSHGILGYAAVHSATLRQGLELFERYFLVRTSLLTATVRLEGDRARLEFREALPLDDIRQPVVETVVLTIKKVIDYVTQNGGYVRRAVFAHDAPGHADLARELFGCEVVYGAAWSGLEMAQADLDRPLQSGNPEAFAEGLRLCQQELGKLRRQQTWAAQVRRVLLESQSGFPSLQLTARLLNLTPRTLHRRLTDEGTSFRDIVEDLRHTLAVEHLKAGRLTIQEIAFTLGYDDAANFRRAFKRWEGVAPSEYRPA